MDTINILARGTTRVVASQYSKSYIMDTLQSTMHSPYPYLLEYSSMHTMLLTYSLVVLCIVVLSSYSVYNNNNNTLVIIILLQSMDTPIRARSRVVLCISTQYSSTLVVLCILQEQSTHTNINIIIIIIILSRVCILLEYQLEQQLVASVKRTLTEENIVFAQRQGAPKLCVYFIFSPLNH